MYYQKVHQCTKKINVFSCSSIFMFSAQFLISQHRQEKHIPWSWPCGGHLLRVPVVRHPCATSPSTITCHVDDVTVSRCSGRQRDRDWREAFSFDATHALLLEKQFSQLGAYTLRTCTHLLIVDFTQKSPECLHVSFFTRYWLLVPRAHRVSPEFERSPHEPGHSRH